MRRWRICDLLRGFDAEAGHSGEPFDGILMRTEQLREFLIKLANVRVDDLQFIARHCEESAIDRMEIGARAQCVAQLIRLACAAGCRARRRSPARFSPLATARSIRRALSRRRSDTKLDLDVRFLEQALEPIAELHANEMVH